jgi:ClpP class serine protease
MWEMERAALYNHARLFLSHYSELSAEQKNNHPSEPFMLCASSGFAEKVYLGRADRLARYEALDAEDVVVNVINFSGPMMRNGGGCAYGSLELRDMIKAAADVPQCIAQVFVVDTPGGSSYSKFDLQEAIEYAHSKGQDTWMYVDGMLASAGMAWGALCNHRVARNPHCTFGCMGTFASFYTNKNGDVNAVTQEMFHEVYATDSTEKNRMFRDSANGDDALIQAELDKSNEQYMQIIRNGIPNVTDELLHGGTWEASEVLGTLCDEICTFDEVLDKILASKGLTRDNGTSQKDRSGYHAAQGGMMEAKKEAEPEKKPEDKPAPEKPAENPDEDPEEEPGGPEDPLDPNEPVDPDAPEVPEDEPADKPKDEPKKKNTNNNPKKTKQMGKQYEVIRAALGLEVLESGNDNALYLHEDLCDGLTETLNHAAETESALEAKVAEVKALNELVANVRAEKETAVAAEVEKANEAIAEKEARIAELEAQVAELNVKLEAAQAEVKELADAPAEQAHPAVPEKSAEESEVVLPSHFNDGKAQREAKANFLAELRKRM